MNRKEASKLVLSELEYVDDLNQEYKTYIYQEQEYRLYGNLCSARLENETQFEYKVRRLFMNERTKNKGTFIWRSKNNENLKFYNLVRNLPKKEGEQNDSFINSVKETTIHTNLGTYNKKKFEKLLEEFNKENKEEIYERKD